MEKKDLVSIIIPVFNRESFLQETIDSVIDQTYDNWQLILVDDGSSDRSLEISNSAAQIDNRILSIERLENRLAGGNAARNYGFEKSTGDFINWFDSDDTMHPDFIANKILTFKTNPDMDLVLSKTIRIYQDGHDEFEKRTVLSKNILEDFISRKLSWYLFDGMFKRSFLENKDLFDEELLAGQDRDFYIRLFAKGLPQIKIIDFYATNYRIHQDSISEKIYREANIKMQLSHYFSLLNQIKVLKKNKLLSKRLKFHYLLELKKRFPSILRSKGSLETYFFQIKNLSSRNIATIKVWFQLILAYFSFKIFGKGERFLK